MYSRNDFLHVLVGNSATACAHVDSLLDLLDPKNGDHSVLYLHYDDGNKIVLCCSMFIYNQPKILLIPKYLFFFSNWICPLNMLPSVGEGDYN